MRSGGFVAPNRIDWNRLYRWLDDVGELRASSGAEAFSVWRADPRDSTYPDVNQWRSQQNATESDRRKA